MGNYNDDIKELVKARLAAMPPDVSFSVGEHGNFSPKQLIHEVEIESDMGKAMIEMQLNFLKRIPQLVSK